MCLRQYKQADSVCVCVSVCLHVCVHMVNNMLNASGLTSRASNSFLLYKHLSDNLLTPRAWLQVTVTPSQMRSIHTSHLSTQSYCHKWVETLRQHRNVTSHSCIYRYKNTWAQWYKHISKIIAWNFLEDRLN